MEQIEQPAFSIILSDFFIQSLENPSLAISQVILSSILLRFTCTGPEAISRPASPPPNTRPSGPAKETLIPPDLLLVIPLSVGIKDPDKERISNRPCKSTRREV